MSKAHVYSLPIQRRPASTTDGRANPQSAGVHCIHGTWGLFSVSRQTTK